MLHSRKVHTFKRAREVIRAFQALGARDIRVGCVGRWNLKRNQFLRVYFHSHELQDLQDRQTHLSALLEVDRVLAGMRTHKATVDGKVESIVPHPTFGGLMVECNMPDQWLEFEEDFPPALHV